MRTPAAIGITVPTYAPQTSVISYQDPHFGTVHGVVAFAQVFNVCVCVCVCVCVFLFFVS